MLGLSSAGAALAGSLSKSKQVINEGGYEAEKEIERLKVSYRELDARSKFILKILLVISGLDFIVSL